MSDFKGGLLDYVLRIVVGTLLTVITFGIMYPWAVCLLYKWQINTHISTATNSNSTVPQPDFSEIGLNGGSSH